jgi:hypothetical protein
MPAFHSITEAAINFINYFVGDGLQGNEFSKNASFKDANGIIWFGGTDGITYFNPQEITNPAKKWNIRITDFYLHNQPVRQVYYPEEEKLLMNRYLKPQDLTFRTMIIHSL